MPYWTAEEISEKSVRLKSKESCFVKTKGDNFFGLILCIIIMAIFGAVTVFFNFAWGITQLISTVLLTVLCIEIVEKKHGNLSSYIETITFHVDNATKECLMFAPMPVVIFKRDGSILWCNDIFTDLMGKKEMFGVLVDTVFEQPVLRKLYDEEKIILKTTLSGRHYKILGNIVKMDKKDQNNNFGILYLFDDSETFEYLEKYTDESPVISEIIVDNYDDVIRNTPESYRSLFIAELDNKVYSWFNDKDCIIKKVERDKFFVIFKKKDLENMIKDKFSLLESVKEIKCGNKFSATLSIGIGVNAQTFEQRDEYAGSAVTLALGRGGDQAVIKDRDNLSYYGGKTREHEKTTKVKARVTTLALKELLSHSSNVIITGHKFTDTDCFGAAVGIHAIAKSMGKDSMIVYEYSSVQVNQLLKRITDNIDYDGVIVSKAEALESFNKSSVIVVVDTHRPAYTECPQLLTGGNEIILIDHHRRGEEFIDNASLVYHEPYASSTCEMVAELLQYAGGELNISQYEAEALYAGIMLDTKDFAMKTGVRTFEAAAFLKRFGVNIDIVRKFFKNDFESYVKIAAIISRAQIIDKCIAISSSSKILPPELRPIVPQAADRLLSAAEVEASFVLMCVDDEICVSARSTGNINVQVIMEKMGGGGHQTVAGVQIKDMPIEDARKKLLGIIEEYMEENKSEE